MRRALAVRVALVDGRLDRVRLERAVARFAPRSVAVVAGVADDDELSSVAAPPPGSGEPPPAPAVAVDRSGVYSPVHPDAYAVRATLSHPRVMLGSLAFGVASLVVIAALGHPVFAVVWSAFFWLFPLLEFASMRRGEVHVAVDRPGVYLGRMTAPTEDSYPRLVPWADVSSVVVFDVRFPREPDPRRGVGVTSTGPDGVARLVAFRLTGAWDLDETRLRDAVRRFAPAVPVVQDPPRSVADLIATSGGPPPSSPKA